MLTLFTVLKPFTDPHVACIQLNALRSWQQLPGGVQIIAFGDKPDVADVCSELGIQHVSGIRCHPGGMEYVSDAFRQAWIIGKYDLMCYVNGDIILPPTFCDVVNAIDCADYLMVGQRHNTPVSHAIPFPVGWWRDLQTLALATGHRHTANGADYFVHRREQFAPLPDLVVGSWFWDNALIGRALAAGSLVIDATETVLAIHQDHSYQHYEGGLGGIAEGAESAANREQLAGGRVYTITDAHVRLLKAGWG